MDVATLVFSHVRCVKTRVNLSSGEQAVEGRLQACRCVPSHVRLRRVPGRCLRCTYGRSLNVILAMLDNDEALSLPYERVVGLLGEAARFVSVLCDDAACRGSVRLLKWTRVNNHAWGTYTCTLAAGYGHLPALKYLHENGCPWDGNTCFYAAERKRWDCFQYTVDNKCPNWEIYAEKYAKHLR